jgi:hypothetical protein
LQRSDLEGVPEPVAVGEVVLDEPARVLAAVRALPALKWHRHGVLKEECAVCLRPLGRGAQSVTVKVLRSWLSYCCERCVMRALGRGTLEPPARRAAMQAGGVRKDGRVRRTKPGR